MRAGIVIMSFVVLGLAAPASAQSDSGANPPTLRKPPAEAPGEAKPSLPNTGESLSDKLDRSNGVIKPPEGVDPEISTPPKDPNAGANMPVIRPQTVPQPQPK